MCLFYNFIRFLESYALFLQTESTKIVHIYIMYTREIFSFNIYN